MGKGFKRVIVMLLCAVLFVSGVGTQSAHADEEKFTSKKITYLITKPATDGEYGEVSAVALKSSFDSVRLEIPETVINNSNTYYVTSIADKAFYGGTFKTLVLPSTIVSIGNASFASCAALRGVTIPAACESIGDSAFFMCSALTSLEFYESSMLNQIGNAAFAYTALEEITLPEALSGVGKAAFFMCDDLTQVYLGEAVDTLGSGAFSGCEALNELSVSRSNNFFKVVDNIIYTKAGDILVEAPAASGQINVLKGVEVVAEYAFEHNRNLSSINLPDSVKIIGKGAFFNCGRLIEVTGGKGLESIGENAFYECISLTDIDLNKGLESIGSAAFQGCTSLSEITIPQTVTSIDGNVFAYCASLESIEVSSKNKTYSASEGMLFGSSGKRLIAYPAAKGNITLPAKVTVIGEWAFQGAGLKSITLSSGIKKVLEGAFYDCESLELVRVGSLKMKFAAAANEVFNGTAADMTIEIPSGNAERTKTMREALLGNCTGRVFIVTY